MLYVYLISYGDKIYGVTVSIEEALNLATKIQNRRCLDGDKVEIVYGKYDGTPEKVIIVRDGRVIREICIDPIIMLSAPSKIVAWVQEE